MSKTTERKSLFFQTIDYSLCVNMKIPQKELSAKYLKISYIFLLFSYGIQSTGVFYTRGFKLYDLTIPFHSFYSSTQCLSYT